MSDTKCFSEVANCKTVRDSVKPLVASSQRGIVSERSLLRSSDKGPEAWGRSIEFYATVSSSIAST